MKIIVKISSTLKEKLKEDADRTLFGLRQREKRRFECGRLTESQFVAVDHQPLKFVLVFFHSISKLRQRTAVHVICSKPAHECGKS